GADQQKWDVRGPLGEMVDEIQELLISPMEILEDQNGGALFGHGLEESRPRREALVPLVSRELGSERQSHQRTEMRLDPSRLGRIDEEGRDRVGQPLACLLGGVV